MSEIDKEGLNKLKERAFILGTAYQSGRDRFDLSNMFTLVLPAVLASIVAVFSAIIDPPSWFEVCSIPLVSILAGLAAVLITIHKVLGCEEYQAECLRLSNVFRSIAQEAEIATYSSKDLSFELSRLSDKFATELENAKATISNKKMVEATKYAKSVNYIV